MDRVQRKLEKLQRRIAAGKLKAPDKIGAAAAAILMRHHGHRYFGWSYRTNVRFCVPAIQTGMTGLGASRTIRGRQNSSTREIEELA